MAAATFSCGLAVSVISGTDLLLTIWIMGLVTTIYTVVGGIKAVMWNDVIQFGVFAVAIGGATYIAITNVPGGWSGTWAAYESAGKLQLVDPRLDLSLRMGTWALVVGQFVEMLSAYAADQSLVQRYLTAKSVSICRRAFVANIAGVLLVIPGLMILGAALSSFYQVHPHRLAAAPVEYFLRKPADLHRTPELAGAMAARNQVSRAEWIRRATNDPALLKSDLTARYSEDPQLAAQDLYQVNRQDEAMPLFVRREMPPGLIGLVVAALLAATMSSLAGGIHSISTSIVIDFKNRFGRAADADGVDQVRFIRRLTLVLGLAATALACVVGRLGPVFDMNKKLNGAFSGPLLAVFILAFFCRRARTVPVLMAAAVGTGLTIWLTSLSELARLPAWLTSTGTISPMWFCVFGFLCTWAIGYLGSLASSVASGNAAEEIAPG
jgi:Na+/proline symporter